MYLGISIALFGIKRYLFGIKRDLSSSYASHDVYPIPYRNVFTKRNCIIAKHRLYFYQPVRLIIISNHINHDNVISTWILSALGI